MRIIHLSDFHLTSNGISDLNDFIMRALIFDLKEQNKRQKIDLIIFTGDLVHQAGNSFSQDIELAFYSFVENVIDPILVALQLERDRFLFVPGNHDVNRNLDSKYIEDGLRTSLNSIESVNDYILKQDEEGRKRILPFKVFERDFHGSFKGEFKITDFESNYIFNINNKKIGITCFNSSWRCYDDEDKNRIILGEKQITRSIDLLSECDIKIALIHHPLDWLANFEIKAIESMINREYNMLFCGHVHEGSAWSKSNLYGDLFFSIAPANWTYAIRSNDNNYCNGYSIIDYEGREIKINHKIYIYEKNKYEINVHLGKKLGETIFRLPDTEELVKENKGKEIVEQIKLVYMPEINEHLLSYSTDTKAPKDIDEVFVLPKIISNVKTKEDEKEEIFSIQDFCSNTQNILINGDKESGKTILLDKIMIELVNEYENYKLIPVFFNFEDITNRIETLISKFLNVGIVNIKEFIDGYNLILLIDDVSFSEHKKNKMKLLNEFISEHPSVKFILSNTGTLAGENLLAMQSYSKISLCKTVQIGQFRTKEIRSLIKKWFSNNETYDPDKLDKIVNIFTTLNIPRTPLAISMFLWIIEQQENYRPINNAVMLENFIERLLKKHSRVEGYSEKFDYRNKERLLAHIANEMFKKNQSNYRLSKIELTIFIREYLVSRKFAFDVETLLEEFINCGIFVLEYDLQESYVSFRFNCFIKYFIMKYIGYNKKFKDFVLNEDNYLLFEDEIDYYTGINRDEAGILELLVERMNKEFKELKEKLIEDNDGLDSFFEIKTSIASRLENKKLNLIGRNKPTQEDLDQMNDHMLESGKQENGIVKKEQSISSFEKLFRSWSLAAKVLKNTEEIEVENLKSDAFNEILFCSMAFAALYKFLLQEHLTKTELKEGDNIEKISRLAEFMPLVHESVIHSFIGTKKLSIVLQELIDTKIEDNKVSDFEKFLLVFLYADLKEDKYIDNIIKLVKNVNRNYIYDMILFKVTSYYYLRSSNKDSDQMYENLIADIVGGSKGKENINKGKVIENYRTKKLLKQYRES